MYSKNNSIKQNGCLICFRRIDHQAFLLSYTANPHLCLACWNRFDVLFEYSLLHGYPIIYLYNYNEFFKSLLFQYKGQYDLALAPVFLSVYSKKLYKMYKDYIIVVPPSSSHQNEIRGFKPMEEIAKSLGLEIFSGLYKKTEYKQSDQKYKYRQKVHDIIDIIGGQELDQRNVLIIDDVVTSGETLLACLRLVKKKGARNVAFLVLSKRVK